jgi:hypothetical protein
MKTLVHSVLTLLLAVGMAMAETPATDKPFELTTLTGQTYKNCRVIKALPDAITVVHDGGVAKVSFENLSEAWRTKFNYDPIKAVAFMEEEEEKQAELRRKEKKLQDEREYAEEVRLSDLAKLEAERAKFAEAQARTPESLAPMPGESTITPVPVVQTEVVVPPFTPISHVYTPGLNRSQTYILRDGGGYYPGYPIGTPIYVNPGYPAGYCPPGVHYPQTRPILRGNIQIGPTTIRINR